MSKHRRTLELEAVARARLIYDLTITAAQHRAKLDVLRVGVDNSGYDVIADWEVNRRYLQLKSKDATSSTRHWEVWPRLLKPRFDEWGSNNILGWQYFHPFGVNGAVILTEVDFSANSTKFRHYYTDVFILCLLGAGVIGHDDQRDPSGRLLKEISQAEFDTRVRVKLTKKNFIMPNSLSHLVELVGVVHGSGPDWKQLFYRAYGQPSLVMKKFGSGPSKAEARSLIREHFSDRCLPYKSKAWISD